MARELPTNQHHKTRRRLARRPSAWSCWMRRWPCWSWSRWGPRSRVLAQWLPSLPSILLDRDDTWTQKKRVMLKKLKVCYKEGSTLCLQHGDIWVSRMPACPRGCPPSVAPHTWVGSRGYHLSTTWDRSLHSFPQILRQPADNCHKTARSLEYNAQKFVSKFVSGKNYKSLKYSFPPPQSRHTPQHREHQLDAEHWTAGSFGQTSAPESFIFYHPSIYSMLHELARLII